MSDRGSEYLKRTCLICGCHTNQTINIYEPRSGPNIVQLIQAKFKFQPLNEDKYLCFSCNNWLINWHSLQAVNSNDAENGAHLNSMPAQQKGAGAGAGNQAATAATVVAVCRPMAFVKPMRIIVDDDDTSTSKAPAATSISSMDKGADIIKAQTTNQSSKCKTMTSRRRMYAVQTTGSKSKKMTSQKMNAVHAVRTSGSKSKRMTSRRVQAALHRSLTKLKPSFRRRQLRRRSKTLHKQMPINTTQNAPKIERKSEASLDVPTQHQPAPIEYLKRPLVDGKIVAMLRRLGTSLTRETENTLLPPIMSPTKPKERFTRSLEDDEILLAFDTAITEVLPSIQMEEDVTEESEMHQTDRIQSRRRLSYSEVDPKHSLLAANIHLPKSLAVSLV